MTDVKAYQLAASFALIPNRLGRCGLESAPSVLEKCLMTGECEGIEAELQKFRPLYSYLQTISDFSGLPPFHPDVVKAYWEGNDLLKLAQLKHYGLLLHYLRLQHTNPVLLERLEQKKPKKFIPTHLFQVIHVGVGQINGLIPKDEIAGINACMIRWGQVEKIMSEQKALVELHSIKNEGARMSVITKRTVLAFNPLLLPNLEAGDIVASHWGSIARKITEEEANNLAYWTNPVLDIFS